MLTDAPPRRKNRSLFIASDQMKALEVPQDGLLPKIAANLEATMKQGKTAEVQRACTEFLQAASHFYHVPECGVRVLAARPLRSRERGTFELFGDYHPETLLIRMWMRTAIRKEVTSFGTFLSTLCHEFCHHLDIQRLGFRDSWHTRGFYERTAVLYHYARGTPAKRLFWVPMPRNRWRIDWPRTNSARDP